MADATILGRIAGQALARPRREFDRLVERYHKQAYNVAYRLTGNHHDAEDLTQEAFVRAFRFFDSYRRDLPFDNWLLRIMSNLFVDEMRRRARLRTQSLDAPVPGLEDGGAREIPDARCLPESQVLHAELDEQVQRALQSLPPDFRTMIILADIEERSYQEISQAVGCKPGTVRSRLHRARKLLRARLLPPAQSG